ncbi:unnamed protein product [Alopecurus aequalis]
MSAPPLEDENLLSEILLRLPPEPSSLPRASAVCKRWRQLVSDPRFTCRFRLHHRRNPPILGFIDNIFGRILFEPTLQAPNRVVPERFSLQQDHNDVLLPLGCRHDLVLMLDPKRKQVLVWEPVTGNQDRIALPPRFDSQDTNGAVLRAAGDVHFQVVLVVSASNDELHTQVLACVYSSKTRIWGNLISSLLPPTNVSPNDDIVSEMPAVLVGGSLYWTVMCGLPRIIEFDLERQSLGVIRLPMDMFKYEVDYELTLMRAEGGGLGFLLVSRGDLSAQLWKRKIDCDGVDSWELGRTIELDKLLSLNSLEERRTLTIVGFAECNNAVFLWASMRLFIVHLESFQFNNVLQTNSLLCCQPFEGVYTAGNCTPLHCG